MTVLTVPTRTLPGAEVLLISLIGDGLIDREIANVLGIRRRAVSKRVSRLLGTYGVDSRSELVALAYREGWLERVPSPRRGPGLPVRQLQVLQLLVDGLGEHGVCAALGLKPNGFRTHIARILDRLEARNRSHAIRIAVDTGIAAVRRQP